MSERLRRLICSICDYRKTHKKNFRHPLPDILILTVLARLCGCSTRKVVSADAMNCQTEIIDLIIKKKAHYFIALKANQRTLRYSVERTSLQTGSHSPLTAIEGKEPFKL